MGLIEVMDYMYVDEIAVGMDPEACDETEEGILYISQSQSYNRT